MFERNRAPTHNCDTCDVPTRDVIHRQHLLIERTQLDGVQVDARPHILPEIVVARIDGVVAQTPIDRRSRLLQKHAMLVENRGEPHKQRDVVLRHIKIVLQASPRVVRIRQVAHSLQRGGLDHLLHGVAQRFRIGDAEHVFQRVPRPGQPRIVHARGLVVALREVVRVEVERVEERVVVQQEIPRVVVRLDGVEELVRHCERVVGVLPADAKAVGAHAERWLRVGSEVHHIEVGLEELGELAEVGVLEEGQRRKDVPVVVDHDEVDLLGVVRVVLEHVLRARVAVFALLYAEVVCAVELKGDIEILLG